MLAVTIDLRSIHDVATMSVTDALAWVDALPAALTDRERAIARMVLKEIVARLGFLADVGLDYLTIDRTSSRLAVLQTPVTTAPKCFASWTAAVPTPPDAPTTATRSPALIPAFR